MPVGFLFLPVGRPRPILTNQILFSCIPKPIPFSICAPLSRLSVPRGKPRTDPRRYTRKRKLPRPKCLPPEAATHRGKCEAGAGASLRASALPCVSPPGNSVRRARDTWTGRAFVLRPPAANKHAFAAVRREGLTVCPGGQALPSRPLRSSPAGEDGGRRTRDERRRKP